MKAVDLYSQLEKDFINEDMTDEWAKYMNEVEEYLSDNFKKRSMGVVCDFTEKIDKVYTAVFPTKEVLKKVMDDDAQNSMLFLHHPSIWDIRKSPNVFYQMDTAMLEKFIESNVSIYNLHVPLDNYSKYSTKIGRAHV